MTGRDGEFQATVAKPARRKVPAVPVKVFDVCPGTAVSTG